MLRNLNEIKEDLRTENYIFSNHAFLRSIERNISVDDIAYCSESLQIIENYPNDKYSPSCLTLGFTIIHRPIHLQVTLDKSKILKIITIYEPDKLLWLDNFTKRSFYDN